MHAILLDEKQSSVLSKNQDSVQVCDPSGRLLGHIVPNGTYYQKKDDWVECLNEWYLQIEELLSEHHQGK